MRPYHTLALKDDGTVVTWGFNSNGQATALVGLRGVTAVSAGGWHTVVLVGTGPEPTLLWWPSTNTMILSWPANAAGFTLQFTLNLAPPVTWLGVTNPPTRLGALFTATNPMSSPSQSLRLRKP